MTPMSCCSHRKIVQLYNHVNLLQPFSLACGIWVKNQMWQPNWIWNWVWINTWLPSCRWRCVTLAMADSPPPDEEAPTNFSIQLIRYTVAIPKTGSTPAVKSKKDIHSKQLSYLCTPNNYVSFMKAILVKFGENKWKVSSQRRFKFKYHHPGRT
jgi:hypothetical protein